MTVNTNETAAALRLKLDALRDLDARIAAARAGVDDAARLAAEAERAAEDVAMDGDAGAVAGADAQATEAAGSIRIARRVLAGLERSRDLMVVELRVTADAARQEVDGAADRAIEAAEARFRSAILRAEAAQAEALGLALASRHHTFAALARLRLPASFMPNDFRPGVGDGLGQVAATMPKGTTELSDLLHLLRTAEAATRGEPAPVQL